VIAELTAACSAFILRFANQTVFEVTPAQDARLQELVAGDGEEPAAAEPFTVEATMAAATRPPRGLRLDRETYASVFSALESGKHVILTGPPGTAKTKLAEAVAEAAARSGRLKRCRRRPMGNCLHTR
jgi:MoxR-like ATPase